MRPMAQLAMVMNLDKCIGWLALLQQRRAGVELLRLALRDRLAVVPLAVRAPTGHRVDESRARVIPGAHAHRHAAVLDLAVHQARARVHRAGGLPVAPVRRLPVLPGQLWRPPAAAWERIGS